MKETRNDASPTEPSAAAPADRMEIRVTALYLAFGAAWILLSDRLLYLLVSSPARQALFQTYKGVFYVLASGALIFFLLRAETRRRKRAEGALRELNRTLEERVARGTARLRAANEELEAFSYSVSHDLRAPLRAVSGFSRILTEDYGPRLDAEARRIIGVIQANTAKMDSLISDLLAFARIAHADLAYGTAEMDGLAREAWAEVVPEGWGGTLELAPLPAARGDKALLKQVWLNLFSNALKFSAGSAAPRVRVAAVRNGAMAEYTVSDNGAGFDPDRAGKLFGVFQRLHTQEEFPGSGVGLAMVKRIVSRHGGAVRASGKPGQGAEFSFSLPAADSAAGSDGDAAEGRKG